MMSLYCGQINAHRRKVQCRERMTRELCAASSYAAEKIRLSGLFDTLQPLCSDFIADVTAWQEGLQSVAKAPRIRLRLTKRPV